MKIGFASGSLRFPVEPQKKALWDWGAQKIFVRDEGEDWRDFLGTLRPTSQAAVTRLSVIADSPTEVLEAIEEFAAKGLLLWIISLKCYVDGNSVLAIKQMNSDFHGHVTIPSKEIAQARAKLSHAARRSNDPFSGRKRKAMSMWHDKETFSTDDEARYAICLLIGRTISKPTLRRRFGNSGRAVGRRK